MLRWARPNRALFSTFFHFLVGIGPELALFDPLFVPYACRCDDALAGVFPPPVMSIGSLPAPDTFLPEEVGSIQASARHRAMACRRALPGRKRPCHSR